MVYARMGTIMEYVDLGTCERAADCRALVDEVNRADWAPPLTLGEIGDLGEDVELSDLGEDEGDSDYGEDGLTGPPTEGLP